MKPANSPPALLSALSTLGTKALTAASLACLALAAGLSCKTYVTYNHDKSLPPDQSGRVSETGFTFRLYPALRKENMVDMLDLTPGDYLIEFRLTSAATSGFARCIIQANQEYGFVITERRYLPEAGAAAWMGECKNKRPGDPQKTVR